MKKLGDQSVNLLCSGQVITSVLDAVKELVENSLDAGARSIRIRLTDMGLESITVTDDGSGIPREGREQCALPFTTSKIDSFEEITTDLSTYGFRGEALHSLACVSDLSIVTKCQDDESAQELKFDRAGRLIEIKETHSSVGTSVSVRNLLSNFPVRVREERNNFNIENLKQFLAKYYIAAPSVRFVVDISPQFTATRQPLNNLSQAVSFAYGPAAVSALCERSIHKYIGEVKVRLTGLVPSPSAEWKDASTTRSQIKQQLLVNGRPVRSNTLEKRVNDFYWKIHGIMPRRYPKYIICIDFSRDNQVDSSIIDINLEPSKGKVMFSHEDEVISFVEELLTTPKPSLSFSTAVSWPNYTVDTEDPPTYVDWMSMASCEWRDVGKADQRTLFAVDDPQGKTCLVSADLDLMYDKLGLSRLEIGRTSHSEYILQYWDQLMELQESTGILKLVLIYT